MLWPEKSSGHYSPRQSVVVLSGNRSKRIQFLLALKQTWNLAKTYLLANQHRSSVSYRTWRPRSPDNRAPRLSWCPILHISDWEPCRDHRKLIFVTLRLSLKYLQVEYQEWKHQNRLQLCLGVLQIRWRCPKTICLHSLFVRALPGRQRFSISWKNQQLFTAGCVLYIYYIYFYRLGAFANFGCVANRRIII